MIHTIPLRLSVADAALAEASAARPKGLATRLAAVWDAPGTPAAPLGSIVSFSGGTSFAGTWAALALAWPDERNPRTMGDWWRLLVPDDTARVTVSLALAHGGAAQSVPLLKAVPAPDGAVEIYGGRETMELRLQDVTAVAARMTAYALPAVAAATVDPGTVAATVLGGIAYSCLYPAGMVDGCLERFPNALMAADDVLVRQQDSQSPLAGQRRIRYGDRDGRIVYRLVEDPATGAPFAAAPPFAAYDCRYTGAQLERLAIEGRYLRVTTPFINPYLDLGSRLHLAVPRARVDETVEVHEIRWSAIPGGEQMTLKCRRAHTL